MAASDGSMSDLDTIIVSETEDGRVEMARRLEATGHIRVVECIGEPFQLPAALQLGKIDLVIAVLGENPEKIIAAVERIHAPKPALVFFGPETNGEIILRAMRLGAKEYLSLNPSPEDLEAMINKLTLVPRKDDGSKGPAPFVGVMGSKGGVGATVIASQLAATLQSAGFSTCLLDLNLRNGDVALHFNVDPIYTLMDVARREDDIDASIMRSIVTPHKSGMSILAAPLRPEDAEFISGAHVARALAILESEYDVVVVDIPRYWDDASLRALDHLSQLILVTSFDLPTLAHTRYDLDLLSRLQVANGKIRLVANRDSRNNVVSHAEAEKFLGRGLDFRIPNDYRTIMDSVSTGTPLCCGNKGKSGSSSKSERSEIRNAFEDLARNTMEWCGLTRIESPPPKGGLSRVRKFMRIGKKG